MTKSKTLLLAMILLVMVASIGIVQADEGISFTKKQIKKLIKIIDIVADQEERIVALEQKTKAISFDVQTVTTLTGQYGQVPIHFVALDNPSCVDNTINANPTGQANQMQYGWCPESQAHTFFIDSPQVTPISVISISIGNQGVGQTQIACWSGGGGNYTFADWQTEQLFDAEGFIVSCGGNLANGMTMQATILD